MPTAKYPEFYTCRIEEMRNAYEIFWRKTSNEDRQRDMGLDGGIILKYILDKYGFKLWIGFNWPSYGASIGYL
jgi:hypothetical protein